MLRHAGWTEALRVASLLLLIVALAASPVDRAEAAAATVTLSLTPSVTTAQPGDTFTVTLLMDSGAVAIWSFQAYLSYPSSQLEVVPQSGGAPVAVGNAVASWTSLLNDDSAGWIRFARGSLSGPAAGIAGKHTLGTVQFRVKRGAPSGGATIGFLQNESLLVDADWQDGSVEHEYRAASGNLALLGTTITIEGASATATATAMPLTTPTAAVTASATATATTSSGTTSSTGSTTASSGTTTTTSAAASTTTAPAAPAPAALPSGIVGATSSAQAVAVGPSRVRLTSSATGAVIAEVDVGVMSTSGEVIPLGFLRDADLGQTYAIVRRESDGRIVRKWVSSQSPLRFQVPWSVVNSQFTFSTDVISALPLDEQHPHPGQLVRRFDGGDDRIFYYDASIGMWRHVPDIATFQALGLYWCDVTSADGAAFERMTIGPPFSPSPSPPRSDYPNCRSS